MVIENKWLKSDNKSEMCLEQNNFCCILLWGCNNAITYSSNYLCCLLVAVMTFTAGVLNDMYSRFLFL
jgi:hypothetical protein